MERTIDRRTLLAGGAAGAAVLMAGAMPRVARAAMSSSSSVTLNWGWWSNSPVKDAQFKAWASEFSKVDANVKMNGEILAWGSYWDKLHTTLAGGNAYDLIGMSSGQSVGVTAMADELFVDVSTLPGYAAVAASLGKTPLSLFSWNNKQFGLPTGIALWSLGYNKDMFTAAGLPLPDPVKPMTWAQMLKVSQQLTIKKAGKTSQYGILPQSAIDPWNLVVMEGGQFYDRQIKPTKMMVTTPAGIRGLADWQQMFTLGVTPPYDHWTDFAGGYFQGMQTGKIAIAAIGPWNFSTIASTKINVGLMPTPKIVKADMESGANGFCIYKGTKNLDAAWEFLKWAVSTGPQLEYVTFSDIPANNVAFAKMDSAIKPAEYAPTLHAEVAEYQPSVVSLATTLSSAINTVLIDLARGKLTPAKAAAQIESVGNDAINQY